MPEVAVIVEFETLEGAEPEFVRFMRDHAQRTFGEDGAPIPNHVIVDELYVDQAAVESHRLNPRMSALRLIVDPMLKSRRMIVARSLAEREPEQGIPPTELNAANDD